MYEHKGLDRQAVGAAAVVAPPARTTTGSSPEEPSPHHQWPAVAHAHGSALVGSSRSVPSLEDDCHALLSPASGRHLGSHPGGSSSTQTPTKRADWRYRLLCRSCGARPQAEASTPHCRYRRSPTTALHGYWRV